LDTIDFMPLVSANYSGGIIITDWYNDGKSSGQSVKISVRFLTNEVRADALDVKVFTKHCESTIDCKVTENKGTLVTELIKSILKMNEEILRKLYDKAGSHFNLPSFEQFMSDMQDEQKLIKFRENMSKHYNIPDIETLKTDIGFAGVTTADKKKRKDSVSASGISDTSDVVEEEDEGCAAGGVRQE